VSILVPAAADGVVIGRAQAAAPARAERAWRLAVRHWGVALAIAFTLALHAPTLRYFFDGDDFVVLGSVEYLGARQYIIDSWLMRDIVPSWRPLTAMIYAAEWRLFGLDATGWRAVNLGVHLASMVVLYALVLRTTRGPAIGALAAMIFGVSGAHFDTVTYVTALPHVLATFFVLSSLLAMVAYANGGHATGGHAGAATGGHAGPPLRHGAQKHPTLYWLSFALFVVAFLSNEGAFVYAPLIAAAYALFSTGWRRRPWLLVLHAAPFAALAAAWLSFYQSCSCEQLKFEDYYWGAHVLRNYGVYLSWIGYPAGGLPLAPDALRWCIAATVTAVLAIATLRGSPIARIAAIGVVLALLPFAPVKVWTASRYSYGAVAFFATLASIEAYAAYERARDAHRWLREPATVIAIGLAIAVASLYAWQTHAQDARSGRYGERWRLLVDELQANYRDVPDGTTIYIIGGPWQNPMEQYTWVPSVARALYGDAAAFDLPREACAADPPDERASLFLEWREGHLRPVTLEQAVNPP
jgi:hypothetical protein